MRRFFVEPSDISHKTGQVTIAGSNDVNHIKKVLRMKPGDIASVSDGSGYEYDCVIETDRDVIVLAIKSKREITESAVFVALYTGLPKQGKMEVIVQKAAELGAAKITPVYMKRSIPKDRGGMEKKTERWQRVALAASKQSGRSTVPEVSRPLDFGDAICELAGYELIVFPYENENGRTIRDVIERHGLDGSAFAPAAPSAVPSAPRRIAVIIGPEGGFAEDEADALIMAGATPCSLGRTILRTETAGMAVLAMLRYEFDL
jgi:16S rRNA (uracil1498-N3)-methyltransferase